MDLAHAPEGGKSRDIFEPRLFSIGEISESERGLALGAIERAPLSVLSDDQDILFATVSWPAYLANERLDQYYAESSVAQFTNFPELAELRTKVVRFVADLLGVLPRYSLTATMPGFHVIRVKSPGSAYMGGVEHNDCSYLNIPGLRKLSERASAHYSFTYLLSPNDCDFGLEWRQRRKDNQAQTHDHTKLNYRENTVAVFDSRIRHRIAPFRSDRLCARVTLQGHVMILGEAGVFYW